MTRATESLGVISRFGVTYNASNVSATALTAGEFPGQMSIDADNGGSFGLAVNTIGWGTFRLAAVDDNAKRLNIWTTVAPCPPDRIGAPHQSRSVYRKSPTKISDNRDINR